MFHFFQDIVEVYHSFTSLNLTQALNFRFIIIWLFTGSLRLSLSRLELRFFLWCYFPGLLGFNLRQRLLNRLWFHFNFFSSLKFLFSFRDFNFLNFNNFLSYFTWILLSFSSTLRFFSWLFFRLFNWYLSRWHTLSFSGPFFWWLLNFYRFYLDRLCSTLRLRFSWLCAASFFWSLFLYFVAWCWRIARRWLLNLGWSRLWIYLLLRWTCPFRLFNISFDLRLPQTLWFFGLFTIISLCSNLSAKHTYRNLEHQSRWWHSKCLQVLCGY